jgi:hypothetical protein
MNLPLSTTNLAAGVMQGTAIQPPVTRPSLQNGPLLNIQSESTDLNRSSNPTLSIVTDPVKKSWQWVDPSAAPNGSNVTFSLRTLTKAQLNQFEMSVPMQFTMTDQAGTVLSAANATGIINSINTAGYNANSACMDYAFNKPMCEWHQMFTTFQVKAGASNTVVQNYSNDTFPNIFTSAFVPKNNTNSLDELFSNNFNKNAMNSRNGNTSTIATTTPWAITLPVDTQQIQSQIYQQMLLTNNVAKIQDAFLHDIFQSIITNTPMEVVFPLKTFGAWFNVNDEVNLPPNFPMSFYINFNISPFIIRSFGNIKIKAQVLTAGVSQNVAYPRIGMPIQEYSAEAVANMNSKLLSSFVNFNYFEGKSIPPTQGTIPIGSTNLISQMTIASMKPVAYVLWFEVINATNTVTNREIFPKSCYDSLVWSQLSINIGGYEIVYLDRQQYPQNYRFITRDGVDTFQANINESFMDLSNNFNFASKSILMGVPLYFVVDPSKYIDAQRIGPPIGPITSKISCTFQEYNPTTKLLGPTTQPLQFNVFEIGHSQTTIDPTLSVQLITPGAKLDGTAPVATQSLNASALSR